MEIRPDYAVERGTTITTGSKLPGDALERAEHEIARLRRELDAARDRLQEIERVIRDSAQISLGVVSMMAARWDTADARLFAREVRLRLGAVGLGLAGAGGGLVDLSPCIGKLSREVESVLGLQRIGCRAELAPVQVYERAAISILLVAVELLTNAYQHAFAGRSFGSIEIKLAALDDTRAMLAISDNGIGMPPAIETNWPRLPSGRDYAGLPVVLGLVRNFGGELRLRAGGGTTFELIFPTRE